MDNNDNKVPFYLQMEIKESEYLLIVQLRLCKDFSCIDEIRFFNTKCFDDITKAIQKYLSIIVDECKLVDSEDILQFSALQKQYLRT